MRRSWIALGVVLLGVGLLGHLLAAHAMGGYYIQYRDHIFGFVILTAVPGALLAGLGSRFWKGRRDITLLILGAIQTLLGIVIYINSVNIH